MWITEKLAHRIIQVMTDDGYTDVGMTTDGFDLGTQFFIGGEKEGVNVSVAVSFTE